MSMSATIDRFYSSTQGVIGPSGNIAWESNNDVAPNELTEPYELVVEELGSVYGPGGLIECVRLDPHSLLVSAHPEASANQPHSLVQQFVALRSLNVRSAMVTTWGTSQQPPATVVSWDPLVQRLQAHPTMNSPEVAEFLQLRPDADIDAIRKHFDLLQSTFSDVGGRTWRYWHHIDRDDGQPYLFLTMQLPEEALEFNELMGREHHRLAKVIASPELQAASEYHIVSAA